MKEDRRVEIVFEEKLKTIIDLVDGNCPRFAKLLDEKGIITHRMYEQILHVHRPSQYEQASRLVGLVRRKLENSPKHFPEFVACLEKLDKDVAHDVFKLYKGS